MKVLRKQIRVICNNLVNILCNVNVPKGGQEATKHYTKAKDVQWLSYKTTKLFIWPNEILKKKQV